MEKLRIVFMGTPDFAVGILDAIYQNNYDIAAVITAPDRPAGRGQKVKYSAVKEYALEKDLKILQPTNLKDESFLQELESLKANLQVVVAFRMLPEAVWKMPKLGTFNLHASLLPQYRGAAPINWAVINGETVTGVTTFFIDDKIDTGEVILKEQVEITLIETAGELHDKLMNLGVDAVLKTLTLIATGNAKPEAQNSEGEIKTAYKLNKDNCKIDWTKSGSEIHNHIRGLSPYPAAWTFVTDEGQEWNVKIYAASFNEEEHDLEVGSIVSDKKEIKVALKDGFINLDTLQFPGKKKMKAQELLNGLKLSANARVK